MLRFDRYLVASRVARDLATGRRVRLRRVRCACGVEAEAREANALLFARHRTYIRIDWIDVATSRIDVWEPWRHETSHVRALDSVDALAETLDDAAHGTPRRIDLPVRRPRDVDVAIRLAARTARRAGWLPIALTAFAQLTARRWPPWLTGRSLVVFAGTHPPHATVVERLARFGEENGRPHIVVQCRSRAPTLTPCPSYREAPRVREAHSLYEVEPSGEAYTLRDEVGARWRVIADELVRAPTSTVDRGRARLATVLAARDQSFEARAVLGRCRAHGVESGLEMRRAAACVAGGVRRRAADALERWLGRSIERWAMVDDFVGVMQLCHETDDDGVALARVGAFLRERLRAASVAFIAADGGQLRVLARAGGDTPGLDAARRAVESGCPVPAGTDRGPAESASPVRYAAEVIGAIWCRWSAGIPIAIGEAGTLLGVAAAASGPSLRGVIERLRPAPVATEAAPALVGESAPMRAVRAAILRAAASPFPVLIEGESGSGKELAAQAIHACGPRRDRRFCAINCAALVDELVEAELFGHTRGAFTGAALDRAGLFEEASGGTLFLDEVAELGGRVQAKLLRVLQEGEVRRIGEAAVRKIDVRIVAATNRPLAGEVDEGRFRRDLWYRLDVVRMPMPPLRERLDDLPLLVRHLWASLAERAGSRATLSPSAVAALGCYDWPGNVRELQNVLASALVAAPRRGTLGPTAWPPHVLRAAALAPPYTLEAARRQFDERFVRAAMARAGGRTSVAARELGLSRQGLSKLLLRLGIEAAGGRLQ